MNELSQDFARSLVSVLPNWERLAKAVDDGSGQFLLDEAEHFLRNRQRRYAPGSSRNAVQRPSGTAFTFTGIPSLVAEHFEKDPWRTVADEASAHQAVCGEPSNSRH